MSQWSLDDKPLATEHISGFIKEKVATYGIEGLAVDII
jgi:hypothetical protein